MLSYKSYAPCLFKGVPGTQICVRNTRNPSPEKRCCNIWASRLCPFLDWYHPLFHKARYFISIFPDKLCPSQPSWKKKLSKYLFFTKFIHLIYWYLFKGLWISNKHCCFNVFHTFCQILNILLIKSYLKLHNNKFTVLK